MQRSFLTLSGFGSKRGLAILRSTTLTPCSSPPLRGPEKIILGLELRYAGASLS
jgi:hypothetical protein